MKGGKPQTMWFIIDVHKDSTQKHTNPHLHKNCHVPLWPALDRRAKLFIQDGADRGVRASVCSRAYVHLSCLCVSTWFTHVGTQICSAYFEPWCRAKWPTPQIFTTTDTHSHKIITIHSRRFYSHTDSYLHSVCMTNKLEVNFKSPSIKSSICSPNLQNCLCLLNVIFFTTTNRNSFIDVDNQWEIRPTSVSFDWLSV